MRTLFVGGVTVLFFAAAMLFGWADTAQAATPDVDEAAFSSATFDLIDVDGETVLEDGEGRRPGPRARRMHRRLLRTIHRACPCNGPEGEGWESHEAFVECVEAKLDELERLPEELKAKILEKAESSQVGEPGFECPTREDRPKRERPGRPGGPGEPGEPGGPGGGF